MKSVLLGGAASPLERAEACQKTTRILANAMRRAVDDDDADRVTEIGDHLELMVRDGLAPNLEEARATIPDGSPDAGRVKKVKQSIANELTGIQESLSVPGKVGGNPKVGDLKQKFDGLRERLK